MCLYMKLSPFPGVSPDIFNNKHFSPIFVSHRKGEKQANRLVEGGRVWCYCLCLFFHLQTVRAICVCLSSKTIGIMSAPRIQLPVAFHCRHSWVFHRYLKANYRPHVHFFIMPHGLTLVLLLPFLNKYNFAAVSGSPPSIQCKGTASTALRR